MKTNQAVAGQEQEKDSFIKFAQELFEKYSKQEDFARVHPADLEEVQVQFAIQVRDFLPISNVRVYPINQAIHFFEEMKKGVGKTFTAQLKIRPHSRLYWVGCSHSADNP